MISTAIVGLISMLLFELCPTIIIKMFGTESSLYMEFDLLLESLLNINHVKHCSFDLI